METLRIVHLDLIPKINGGHVAIANLVKALVNRGHEVHLIRNAPDTVAENSKKINVVLDGTTYNIHYLKHPKTFLDIPMSFRYALNKLQELDSELHFDVIHAHTAGGFSIVLSKRKDWKSKFVVSLHGDQLNRALMLAGDVTRYPKTLLKTSYMSSLALNFLGAIFYAGLETIASWKSVMTTVPSEFDKALLQKVPFVEKDKIVAVPNCLDEDFYTYASNLEARANMNPESEPVILFSGSLIPLKGVHYLLEAMPYIVRELPTAKLILAGEGMLRKQVATYSKLLGNNNIICPGWLPHQEMERLYSSASVLAHPSLYESCSLTIAEALSIGVPVVAFNTAAIPEFVVNGKTGLLAELGNSRDLASKITKILKNRVLAKKISQYGREFAKQTFSPLAVAQKMEEVYKRVSCL